jgi:hypothetical protein
MKGDDSLIGKDVLDRLIAVSVLTKAAAKDLTKLSEDPFAARELVLKYGEKLNALNLSSLLPTVELVKRLDHDCTMLRAEFWNRFADECTKNGWKLVGSTTRRMLNQGLFIRLKDDKVEVEDIGLSFTPFVPSLVESLKPIVDRLLPEDFNEKQFMDLLIASYNSVPGQSERPVEDIYRAAVWLSQKANFWKQLSSKSFVPLIRPAFRAQLSQLLVSNSLTNSGHNLRFGTTSNPKDAWELYSPGEGRVVQIARMAIT